MKQSSLFNIKSEPLLDGDTGCLRLTAEAVSLNRSKTFFETLRRDINWQQESLSIAGKDVPLPRLQAWYGDPDAHYSYSGLSLSPQPWTPALLELKQLVEVLSSASFNSVLLNLYRDGQDGMGWHSDDESELGCEPVIASLSLGAARHFSLRQKSFAKETLKILLEPGSLLIMSGALQEHWQHQVAKTRTQLGERINLTFRLIKKVH